MTKKSFNQWVNSKQGEQAFIDSRGILSHAMEKAFIAGSESERQDEECRCNSIAKDQCAFWDGEGGCIHPKD